MPVAQQEQWPDDQPHKPGPAADSAAIARLEAALSRIASAAGRQQDQLRVAELTVQTAQYELETLLHDRRAPAIEAETLAARLDALIATVHTALGEEPAPVPAGTDADRD